MAGVTGLRRWWGEQPLIDRILLLGACGLVAASFTLFTGLKAGQQVHIYQGDRLVYNLPLSSARDLRVEGPLGETLIRIEEGAVRVLYSPCPNKTCMRMGAARHVHDLIACVPNRVVVEIVGDEEPGRDYDLLSQ